MSRNIAAGLSLALLAALASARPAPANEHPNWVLPSCDAALDEIASAFREKEARFWNSNAQIVDFAQVQETAFRPWGAADVMSRRFCRADAKVTDGAWHPVYFSIEAGMGEIGATWGVQWCVVGFDRNWAYNPDCRMAKP